MNLLERLCVYSSFGNKPISRIRGLITNTSLSILPQETEDTSWFLGLCVSADTPTFGSHTLNTIGSISQSSLIVYSDVEPHEKPKNSYIPPEKYFYAFRLSVIGFDPKITDSVKIVASGNGTGAVWIVEPNLFNIITGLPLGTEIKH